MESQQRAMACTTILRVVGGVTRTLSYDRESHLTAVEGEGMAAGFVYDAGGNRVVSTINGERIVQVGGVYEWHAGSNSGVSYYQAGGQRVAVRRGEQVNYLIGDQLGLTAGERMVVEAGYRWLLPVLDNRGGGAGGETEEVWAAAQTSWAGIQRYDPYGETRGVAAVSVPYQYTGQQHEGELGLYDYGANGGGVRQGRTRSESA